MDCSKEFYNHFYSVILLMIVYFLKKYIYLWGTLMHTVTIDKVLNKMVITLTGIITDEDVEKAEVLVKQAVTELKPKFSVITNLSHYKARDKFPTQKLQHVMQYLIEHNVGKIIRVVGGSKEGLIQFAKHSKGVDDYNVSYVATMKEALTLIREK